MLPGIFSSFAAYAVAVAVEQRALLKESLRRTLG